LADVISKVIVAPSVSAVTPCTEPLTVGLVKVLLVKVWVAVTPATVTESSLENTIPADPDTSALTKATAFKRLSNSAL